MKVFEYLIYIHLKIDPYIPDNFDLAKSVQVFWMLLILIIGLSIVVMFIHHIVPGRFATSSNELYNNNEERHYQHWIGLMPPIERNNRRSRDPAPFELAYVNQTNRELILSPTNTLNVPPPSYLDIPNKTPPPSYRQATFFE